MSRHFQPVILYDNEHSFSLPVEKKQQIHNMLRMNGRLWTALMNCPMNDQELVTTTGINKDCRRRHLYHQRMSSQDLVMSSSPSSTASHCHSPQEIDDIPLDFQSPYINDDSGVENNQTTGKRSGKRKSSVFNRHQTFAPTSPVLSSSSSISSSSSPPSTPIILTAAIRKRRGNLPKTITCLLKDWLILHADHPYPSDDEKSHLQRETNLTINQISNWFINARRRLLPCLINGAHSTTANPSIEHPYQHQAQQKGSSNGKRKRETRKHTVALKKSKNGSGMIKKHAPSRHPPSHRPKRTCRSHQSSSLLGWQ